MLRRIAVFLLLSALLAVYLAFFGYHEKQAVCFLPDDSSVYIFGSHLGKGLVDLANSRFSQSVSDEFKQDVLKKQRLLFLFRGSFSLCTYKDSWVFIYDPGVKGYLIKTFLERLTERIRDRIPELSTFTYQGKKLFEYQTEDLCCSFYFDGQNLVAASDRDRLMRYAALTDEKKPDFVTDSFFVRWQNHDYPFAFYIRKPDIPYMEIKNDLQGVFSFSETEVAVPLDTEKKATELAHKLISDLETSELIQSEKMSEDTKKLSLKFNKIFSGIPLPAVFSDSLSMDIFIRSSKNMLCGSNSKVVFDGMDCNSQGINLIFEMSFLKTALALFQMAGTESGASQVMSLISEISRLAISATNNDNNYTMIKMKFTFRPR